MTDLHPHIRPLFIPAHVPDDIKVWLVQIDLAAALRVRDWTTLDIEEQARARRYARHADGVRFAAVRTALRTLLAITRETDPAYIVINSGKHGRPFLQPTANLDFNVSHSGSYGLIALSEKRRVGIDIEEKNRSLNWRELATLVLASSDQEVVDAFDNAAGQDAFFDCWVGKEAVLKVRGTGIADPTLTMTSFGVLPLQDTSYSLTAQCYDYAAVALDAPDGFAAALAWTR
jgi:4'-phosphopantetheinyl transferase